jgi:hypothetical protein
MKPTRNLCDAESVLHRPSAWQDDAPAGVVVAGRGRDVGAAGEHDRNVDETNPAVGPALGEEVEGHGEDGADESPVHHWVVEVAGREHTRWANDAPERGVSGEQQRTTTARTR